MSIRNLPPLSTRLREAVTDLHRELEDTPFIRRLLRNEITRTDYGRYLSLLHPVYLELESGLEKLQGDPILAPLHLPWIFRSKALEADLASLDASPADSPRTALARRIREVSRTQPALLTAYFYTRYFGDLYGGQMIAGAIGPSLGLTPENGLAFCHFDTPSGLDDAKQSLRTLLDRIPFTEEEIQKIVDEAVLAFKAHREIFDLLEYSPVGE